MYKSELHKKTSVILLHLICFTGCVSSRISGIPGIQEKNYVALPLTYSLSQPNVFLGMTSPFLKPGRTSFLFVIDTGSPYSFINESLFTGLKRKRKITLKSISAVSSAEYSEIETDLIFSDNMRLQKAHFFGTKFGETIEFDGLIGNDLLSRFHLFIDFPDSILFIERRFDYGNLGDSGFDSINFLFENGNVFIPAWIGGKRFNRMVFDTGAGLSYLNASKIDSINLSEAGVTQYIDIFGVRKFDSLYKVSGICLFNPDYCEKNVKALLGDSLKNFQDGRENMDGIIGNALMNRTFVLIDYSKKKIYFKLKSKNVQ